MLLNIIGEKINHEDFKSKRNIQKTFKKHHYRAFQELKVCLHEIEVRHIFSQHNSLF